MVHVFVGTKLQIQIILAHDTQCNTLFLLFFFLLIVTSLNASFIHFRFFSDNAVV